MEWYTATHSDHLEDILYWPWKRFDRLYEAAKKRTLIETLESRKNQMIAALWSNSNYDDDKGTRKDAIESMENQYDEAVLFILTDGESHREEEIDDKYGFFAAGKRGQAKLGQPTSDEAKVAEVIDYTKYTDQS